MDNKHDIGPFRADVVQAKLRLDNAVVLLKGMNLTATLQPDDALYRTITVTLGEMKIASLILEPWQSKLHKPQEEDKDGTP